MVTRPGADTSDDVQEASIEETPAVQHDAAAADAELPAALIAQAESAIYGQFESDDMPAAQRGASRADIRQNAPRLK